MRDNAKYVVRVMLIHISTYILCGIIFSTIFNYSELYQVGNTKYFMRAVGGASSLIGPAFQILRGLLFGFILLLFKTSVIETKYGWLKLWIIIAGLGIINTPGPAPSSIEGIIYTQLPMEVHIKGAFEILCQTLLFSIWVATPVDLNENSFIKKHRISFISAIVAGVLFSLSGIISALILKVDVMAGTTDIWAFVIMFAAIVIVFFLSKWYKTTSSKLKHILFLLFCYLALAVVPTVYNYLSGSVFASSVTLLINIIPVIVLLLINCLSIKSVSMD